MAIAVAWALVNLGDLSSKDAAGRLGITPNAVDRRSYRAREWFKTAGKRLATNQVEKERSHVVKERTVGQRLYRGRSTTSIALSQK